MNPDEVGSFIVMIVTVAVGAVMASKSTGCFFKGLAFFVLYAVYAMEIDRSYGGGGWVWGFPVAIFFSSGMSLYFADKETSSSSSTTHSDNCRCGQCKGHPWDCRCWQCKQEN